MTLEEQLQQFYRGIDADPDAERRVQLAVLHAPPARTRRRSMPVILAVATVVVVAALVALLRPGSHPATPTAHSPSATPVVPVVPAPARDTITGAVLDGGTPLPGSRVEVQAWPNSSILSRLTRGQTVPTLPFPPVVTGPRGSFTVTVPAKARAGEYREGDAVNVEIDVVASGGSTTSWNVPLQLRDGHTEAMRIVFDIGRKTVTVDGTTSPLSVN